MSSCTPFGPRAKARRGETADVPPAESAEFSSRRLAARTVNCPYNDSSMTGGFPETRHAYGDLKPYATQVLLGEVIAPRTLIIPSNILFIKQKHFEGRSYQGRP
jgi:hypothetical protein